MANGTQTVDLAELAKKYGGKSVASATPQAPKLLTDMAALAAKHGGKPVAPSQSKTPSQAQTDPFRSGVMEATGFNPDKIISKGGFVPQSKEMASELGQNLESFGKSVLQNPVKGIAAPIRQMALALEFHTGKPYLDSELKKQGIDETAIDEIRRGFEKDDHQALAHGAGRLVGALGNVLGAVEAPKVLSDVAGVGEAASDLSKKRAIISDASNKMLDNLRDNHNATIDTAVKAERARIAGNVASLNTKDIAADPNGYVPQKLAIATLDQAISDKKAQVLFDKRMLPKVAQVRGLLEGHGQNLTFNDLKQVRSIVGGTVSKATGVEKAVLGDYYSSLTKNLKGRAAHLGGLSEWEDYNSSTERLADHEKGLIPELKDSKTGLDYAKKIAIGSNKGRLGNLIKDLHLPDDFFSKDIKTHKAIINFAKMSEGDSITARTASRLTAIRQYPKTAFLGAAAGATVGRAFGTAVGSPMAGSFIGLTLGAVLAHDLMSKFDAARAIREIGGPEGVTGRYGVPSPSGAGPSTTGPGGPPGGTPSPTQPPALPSGSSPSLPPVDTSTLSPALAKLLPPSSKEVVRGAGDISDEAKAAQVKSEAAKVGGREAKGLEAEKATAGNVPFQKAQLDAAIDRSKEIIRDSKSTVEEKEIAASQLKVYREQAAKLEAKPEPKVTKAAPEARGRTESARSGMTKDTPEARRAKAAERIAAKREEASRTQIKGSLEDQARQVAGRMDFQGRSVPELEEGLQELYGENGKRFLVEFRKIAKQQKWAPEVYRGYLEDTIDRRAKELASKPNLPGLTTEAKKD